MEAKVITAGECSEEEHRRLGLKVPPNQANWAFSCLIRMEMYRDYKRQRPEDVEWDDYTKTIVLAEPDLTTNGECWTEDLFSEL